MINLRKCELRHEKHRLDVFALCFMLCSLVSYECLGDTLPDVIDQVRGSIVGVGTLYPARQPNRRGDPVTYLGTGFVVGNGRQVVTNAHVVPEKLDAGNNQSLAIFAGRGSQAKAYVAHVVQMDKEHDLALLSVDGPQLQPMSLGDSDKVREGQDVAFTGFPIGMVLGLFPVTHRGMVSAITPLARPMENARSLNAAQVHRIRNPFYAFQLDATAYPGNSGSPVYEPSTGRVIGVINSVVVKESKEAVLQKPSGISYAIPAKYVVSLLAAAKDGRAP